MKSSAPRYPKKEFSGNKSLFLFVKFLQLLFLIIIYFPLSPLIQENPYLFHLLSAAAESNVCWENWKLEIKQKNKKKTTDDKVSYKIDDESE